MEAIYELLPLDIARKVKREWKKIQKISLELSPVIRKWIANSFLHTVVGYFKDHAQDGQNRRDMLLAIVAKKLKLGKWRPEWIDIKRA